MAEHVRMRGNDVQTCKWLCTAIVGRPCCERRSRQCGRRGANRLAGWQTQSSQRLCSR